MSHPPSPSGFQRQNGNLGIYRTLVGYGASTQDEHHDHHQQQLRDFFPKKRGRIWKSQARVDSGAKALRQPWSTWDGARQGVYARTITVTTATTMTTTTTTAKGQDQKIRQRPRALWVQCWWGQPRWQTSQQSGAAGAVVGCARRVGPRGGCLSVPERRTRGSRQMQRQGQDR